MVDWSDPKAQVTEHFTVKDCLWLPQWNRLATAADGADFDKLLIVCLKMEEIRTFLDCPINSHSMFRPKAYNKLIGAIPEDVHFQCLADDFDCNDHFTTDEVKAMLLPVLEQYGLRMEDNGEGASWVHLDLHPVIHNRFFKP